ncbi:MAG: ferredoxin [Planctomycetes bacterium]|nr:ferredoxin [Planctomycetota bacterium]
MKAKVDPNVCIGCTLCTQICPEVFRMEGNKSVAHVDIVPKEVEESCKKAAESCPVGAIKITE